MAAANVTIHAPPDASPQPILLTTKLYRPPPGSNLMPRPRLTQQLNENLTRQLTLVSAPAGFGKTTLLSEWIPHSQRCVVWISLDEGDNDPTRFWAYFIAGLQQLTPELGQNALSLFQSPQPPQLELCLTTLLNEVAAFPDVFALVLNDYHIIENPAIHQALTFMLDHLPAQMHLIIATRVDPPLPLSRLRSRGQLTELRAADLRFTTAEATIFLNEVMGLSLSAADVAALETHTEGWIVGLQLAALSMQGRQDVAGFITAFTGTHRYILDYLTDEVLERRPTGTQNFLLQTSILDRLCGPLCDAVTGGNDSQATLERLEQANLFIMALDDERRWYRYHPLFAEVLRARLRQAQPNSAPELHRRASRWYEEERLTDEAVHHALTGRDFEQAARLIERVAGTMVRQGASASLVRWLEAIPEETIRAHSRLCLDRAWTFHWGPALSMEKAEAWAQLALRAASANGSLDSSLTGEVAALQAMIAATRSEVARSRELSRQALDDLPLDSPWRSAVALCLGTAHIDSGDMAAAARVLDEALRLSQADGVHYIQLAAASFLADIQVFQGHLGRAMEMYQQVLAWVDLGLSHKGAVMAHGGLANILYERNQFEAALAHIQLGANQLDQVGGAWAAYVLYRVLARVQQAQGNWTDALATLDRAYQMGQSAQISLVMTQAAALRACLQLAQDDLGAAEIWAANSGLGPDDAETSHPGWREVEYLSLARVLAAQGRFVEALSLLERLLLAAEADGRLGSAIEILIRQSLIMQMQGNVARALALLERALVLAEPEGYIRIFVDEGAPMAELLEGMKAEGGRLVLSEVDGMKDYVLNLLTALEKDAGATLKNTQRPPFHPSSLRLPSLVEPLTEREMELLRLVAAGHSNQKIAQELFLAVGTVKKHLNNIFGKLGVRNRTQASARARELDLL